MTGVSQEIHLIANDVPLNRFLVELRESNDLKFSFDDELLSKFRVSVDRTFPNPDQAITYLISDLPLRFDKVDGVFLIYPAESESASVPEPNNVIFGIVTDATNGETLPFSHLYLNRQGVITDGQGRYSYASTGDTLISVQVSYLGYYQLDTLLASPGQHNLLLHPSIIGIKEVVVADRPRILSSMSGLNAGEIRINHQVGSYLPGFADNSVYNLLRLQPGVLAAGEQANDLIIWGSYPGQTSVFFDGFTLFGLKNYDDNIGVVNPLMVKDIRLLKGGYPANYGGKAGGIVDITGISGNRNQTEFDLTLTNLILNTKLSIPLSSRSAVSVAFRQTFYNLYNGKILDSLLRTNRKGQELVDFSVKPHYTFRDFNFKYAGNTKSGDVYFLDFMTGSDQFKYLADFKLNNRVFESTSDEKNRQTGASFFYSKVWDHGNTSNFTMSFSQLIHEEVGQTQVENNALVKILRRYISINNTIDKSSALIDNHITINQNHTLEFGLGVDHYEIQMVEDSLDVSLFNSSWNTTSLVGYLQDRISFKNGLSILAGVRVENPFYLGKSLVQPRISLNYKVMGNLWFKAAWGRYDQYVVQSSVLDDAGNLRYFWRISDGEEIPVQSANHLTGGIHYERKNFSVGVDAYYKKLTGLTRYINNPNMMARSVFVGEGFSKGIDFLIEGKYGKHTGWIGYSLSQTMEHFNYFMLDHFVRAPQDQRHEFKVAALFNFHPYYFSTNYVFGSGFPDRSLRHMERATTDLTYSRWDVSGFYQFGFKRMNVQTGISILNLLNAENIKLQNFVKIPNEGGGSVNILAEAVPFTPTLFLVVKF